MKFKVQAADLNEALGSVSSVTPSPLGQGPAGFLFIVKGDRCFVYSRDDSRVARADFPVTDVDEDGSFVYPAEYISSFKFAKGWIEFEAGKEDERFYIKHLTEGGQSFDRSGIDPRMIASCDDDLEGATEGHVMSAAILREALSLVKPFVAAENNSRAAEHHKGLQIFDDSNEAWKKGDGTLFATNGVRACYVFCELFKGKGLVLLGQHLGHVMTFLSKSEGDITLRNSENMLYAVDSKGRAIGWGRHEKTHPKYGYHPFKLDKYVLGLDGDLLLNELRYIRQCLDPKRDKIRVTYDHKNKSLRFLTSETSGKGESAPVLVKVVVEEGKEEPNEDFACNVNVNALIELFEGVKNHVVDLRIAILPPKNGSKGGALFRTVDDFKLTPDGKVPPITSEAKDAFQCRVTRFTPSMD